MLRLTLLTGLPLEYWQAQPLAVLNDFRVYGNRYGFLDDQIEIGAAMIQARIVQMAGKAGPDKSPSIADFTWSDKVGREPIPDDVNPGEAELMKTLQGFGVKLEKGNG